MRLLHLPLLALLICAGCEKASQRTVQGLTLDIQGIVSIQPDRYSPESPLPPNAVLSVGSIIRTESGASASIALLPNALVELAETSKLEILALTIAKNGNETQDPMGDRFGHIKLWRGALFLSHERNDTARTEFRVTTSQGEVLIGATALCKLEAGNHHARLTNVSGQVTFQRSDNSASSQIPAGNVAEWNSGAASLVPAATDRLGQEDLVRALEVEQKLRTLRRTKRNVLPGGLASP